MIASTTRLRLARVPLAHILITEVQPRYAARVQHYVTLLSDPAHAHSDPGVIALAPHPDARLAALGYYTLLDGHQRVVAAIIVGRADLLALIAYEPGDPGYAQAAAPEPGMALAALEVVAS